MQISMGLFWFIFSAARFLILPCSTFLQYLLCFASFCQSKEYWKVNQCGLNLHLLNYWQDWTSLYMCICHVCFFSEDLAFLWSLLVFSILFVRWKSLPHWFVTFPLLWNMFFYILVCSKVIHFVSFICHFFANIIWF